MTTSWFNPFLKDLMQCVTGIIVLKREQSQHSGTVTTCTWAIMVHVCTLVCFHAYVYRYGSVDVHSQDGVYLCVF